MRTLETLPVSRFKIYIQDSLQTTFIRWGVSEADNHLDYIKGPTKSWYKKNWRMSSTDYYQNKGLKRTSQKVYSRRKPKQQISRWRYKFQSESKNHTVIRLVASIVSPTCLCDQNYKFLKCDEGLSLIRTSSESKFSQNIVLIVIFPEAFLFRIVVLKFSYALSHGELSLLLFSSINS